MLAVLVVLVPVIFFILPETKGVPLEMIQHFFSKQRNIFNINIDTSKVEVSDSSTENKKDTESMCQSCPNA